MAPKTLASALAALDAVDDAYGVDAGETLTVGGAGVVENDTVSGSYLTAVTKSTDHGALDFNGVFGSFTYTPDENFTGTDTFTYRLYDAANPAAGDTATVTITVNPVGPAPIAADDGYIMASYEASLSIEAADGGVLHNDTNAPVATLDTGASNGTVDLDADGSFTYTPDAGFFGVDSFTYRASGPGGVSAPATVSIRVVPLDAVDDRYEMTGSTLDVPDPGVRANDASQFADTLIFDDPAHGDLQRQGQAGFIYTPDPGFTGTESFTYTLFSQRGFFDEATITIVVPAPGDALAIDDAYTVQSGQTLTVAAPGVVGNDLRPGRYNTVLLDGVDHGDLTYEPAFGSFTYEPDAGFIGTDTFRYTLFDASDPEQRDDAIVRITVTAPDPVANPDSYSTAFNTQLTVNEADGVLDNDTDADSVSLDTDVSHGTLSLSTDGSFTYTPSTGYSGTDSFTYTATGPGGTTDPATVTITVSPPPAPVAGDDRRNIQENGTASGDGDFGVLANDSNYVGGTLTVVTQPAFGQVTLNQDGSFAYVADQAPPVEDSFEYQIETAGGTATATVYLELVWFAYDDAYEVDQGETLTVPTPGVTGNDNPGPCPWWQVDEQGSHGTAVMTANGYVTYEPDPGFSGTDQFTYLLSDCGDPREPFLEPIDTATVTITVNPVTVEPPVAVDDSYETDDGEQLSVDAANGVLGNDTGTIDADGATLGDDVENGSLELNADGSFTYTPDDGFTGTDTFTYTATGPGGTSAPATVTITVSPDGAVDDTYTTTEDTDLHVAIPGVLGNDPIGSVVLESTDPSHGALGIGSGGDFDYYPDEGFTGTDSFTYTTAFGTATVTITVVPAGTAPVANDDSYEVDEGDILVVSEPGVIGNDPGATGARLVSGVDHGDLDFNEDGSFTYVPDDDYNGTDEFRYVATNDVTVGQLGQSVGGLLALDSEPATVTLVINSVPESDDDDDDDDDSDGGDDGGEGGSDGSRSNGAGPTLPDAGSPIRSSALTWTTMLLLVGSALIILTRRRGRHVA